MNTLKLRNLIVPVACLAALGTAAIAGAQSVRHDFMDMRAARADIERLQVDRARAEHYGNWGKVAQDDRLIAQDRFWIRRDEHKLNRGY